jgi:DNA-binding transcriptional MerR regulator
VTAIRQTDALRSGELARLAGVSPDTLRHYERKGVLRPPARSANGYRLYPWEALDRVRLVRTAIAFGFTLDELAEVLGARDRGRAPCRRVRSLAASKLAAAEASLAELTALVDALRRVVASWDDRLASTPEGAAAGLLESLAAERVSRGPGQTRRFTRRIR